MPAPEINLDELLDISMGEVVAAPDFCDPSSGDYVLSVSKIEPEKYTRFKYDENTRDKIEGSGHAAVRVRCVFAVVGEPVYEADDAPVITEGSLFSKTFNTDEAGLTYLKRDAADMLKVAPADLDGSSLRELIEAIAGVQEVPFRIVAKTDSRGFHSFKMSRAD